MNVTTDIGKGKTPPALTLPQRLLQSALGGLEGFARSLDPLRQALTTAAQLGDENTRKMALRLIAKLDRLEPSVTMIGQIKSGKTSLVNSMIGWPDLLPADVNPWTSVVTSLHLTPKPRTPETTAVFSFFEEDEWDRLIAGGGRIGELANRAGADDELSKIKAQVEAMREKSKARLGRKFEMLLGQQHDYGYFDKDLIERYVCLGDDFDDAAPEMQGRFADITKSADLTFHQPAVPMRLCIRDTPGVNDTFMMREQITIRSIRDSRICIVVLSAHQALSSTDLALVRLISNVKSRDIIIFVNRMDELSDPATQVDQIRQSILETLARHNGPADAQIIFGSALWAQKAMSGGVAALPEASKTALLDWAKANSNPELRKMKARGIMWELSGLPALYDAMAERIRDGIGNEAVAQIAASARNLVNGIRMSDNLAAKAQIRETSVRLRPEDIQTALTRLQQESLSALHEDLSRIQSDFASRCDRAHDSFLGRATDALVHHLECYGDQSIWEYDPSGLRVLLSSACKSYGVHCQAAYNNCIEQTINGFAALYQQALDLPPELFDIKAPPAPVPPPPVSLGQTIALDLKGNWWRNWWFKRRGYQAYAADFHAMIKAETDGFLTDLKTDQINGLHSAVMQRVQQFIAEQSSILLGTVEAGKLGKDKLDTLLGRQSLQERDEELTEAHRQLDRYGT